jgi:YVTN family beta-propeller protein
MEFRMLGELEVRDGGDRRIPLGAGKQRAVLALLLLHANEVVATDRLIDELWGESPPETARKAVQVHITRLRKALGAGRIRTRERGYVLDLDSDELDLRRFERRVLEARDLREQGEDARAADVLRDALGLWNGPPLADFAYEPFAQNEIARLEELRLEALEERVDADLAIGHGGDLVGELEILVAQHPYRERLRGQLMLALYRDGRQAEALAVYQQTRRLLVDELGIEPSPALQRLEGAILRQEPALETVFEEARPTALPKPRRRRRWTLAAAGAGLALITGAVAFAVIRASGPDHLSRVDENAIGVIDAEAAGIESQVSLAGRPSAIAAGGGFVWVASEADGTVSRIDPETGAVQTLPLEGGVAGLAYGSGALWVANPEGRTVAQIDPGALRVVQTVAVGNGPSAVAVGQGAVWVGNTFDGTLSRIDLAGEGVETISLGTTPAGIAVGGDGVWVTSEAAGTALRVDPRSGRVLQPVGVGNGPTGVAADGQEVWVVNRQDGTVTRIDPSSNSVSATIEVGESPTAVAIGVGAVWVANGGDGTIARIDAEGGRVEETIELESSPSGLALADGKVWTTTLPSPHSHRGGVLRVEVEFNCDCIDPAFAGYAWLEWGAFTLTYDGLVAYRRVDGIAGAALVPDLAARIPRPTDEDTTYTFELRPGISYSDGTPVRASDIRTSLERLLSVNPDTARLYGSIVGAAACRARPARPCDLSAGIEVDDTSRTISIRLAEADPDFLHALALPYASVVPARTPARVARERPIPGTGPYRILPRESLGEIRFVRNPYFDVWSTDARPDGYPDEIRFHVSGPERIQARLAAVEEGRADLVSANDHLAGLGAEGLTRLLTRYAGRLHLDSTPASFFMFLNTRVPPFDDVRVRRALNYAFDRRGFLEAVAHPAFVDQSCQIIPSGFPGHTPHCPYTVEPNEAGTWTAPDRAKARALIGESGTQGMRVEVWSFADSPPALKIARYFVSLLDRLGYRSSLRTIPTFAEYLEYVGDSRNRAQIGQMGWGADTLTASTFLQDSFSCSAFVPESPGSSNFSKFCDPALDAKMERAAARQSSDPAVANALWADVDRVLVDRAVTVPFASPRFAILVSERVVNYQSHLLWGPLFDQLWVQ